MKTVSKFILILLASLTLATLLPGIRVWTATAAFEATPVLQASDSRENSYMSVNPILGPKIQLSRQVTGPGEDWFYPAVAFNSLRQSQIMFAHAHSTTGGDIYGYYWSEVPDDWVYFWAMNGVQPALAYNRTEDDFLLVSMYDSDQDGRYEIWGKIIQGDASDTTTSFLIFQWANRSFWSPRVVWNSYRNEYLVVWNAMDTMSGLPNDVSAARVSVSGIVQPGAPHIIASTGSPHQADVTYNLATDEYLVVWRQQGVGSDWDIWGARLQGSNAAVVTPPGAFAVNTAPEDQSSPAVTTNQQGHYMVVWEYAYPGPCCDWDIRGQELDVSSALVGNVIIISQTTDDETNPQVVAQPGLQRDYAAVWQKDTAIGSETWMSRWGEPGVQFEFFQVTAAAGWDHMDPTVVVANPSYLVAYEAELQGDPTQFRHIFSRRWTPNMVFLPAIPRN